MHVCLFACIINLMSMYNSERNACLSCRLKSSLLIALQYKNIQMNHSILKSTRELRFLFLNSLESAHDYNKWGRCIIIRICLFAYIIILICPYACIIIKKTCALSCRSKFSLLTSLEYKVLEWSTQFWKVFEKLGLDF